MRTTTTLFLLTLLVLTAPCWAQQSWTLTDAHLTLSQIQTTQITPDTITTANSQIPWTQTLELSRNIDPATPEPYEIFLAGGDHIFGTAAGVFGEKIIWKNSFLGSLNLTLDNVAAIVRGSASAGDLSAPRTDDVVHLSNGDTAHGVVTNVCALGVTLQTGADATTNTTLPWMTVNSVLFSSSPQPPPAARMFRVHLSDGSAISIPAVSESADKINLTLSDQTVRPIDPAAVATIEQINGPLTWLTDLTPAENIYKPYFNEWFPARFDETVADNKPIGQKYPGFHHGIGCHAYSRISYALTGQYAAFRTQFAVDSDSSLADVTVRILLDGKPALEEKNIKAGQIYPVVTIPLGTAKTLSLEVDYGQNFATQARFVWLDPALLRAAQ